jgi:hypothetical protein
MSKKQALRRKVQTDLPREKGLNIIRKTLADGTVKTYVYRRDGGPLNGPAPGAKIKVARRPNLSTTNPSAKRIIEDAAIRSLISRTKIRSKLRKLPMELRMDDIRRKLEHQRRRCAVTGLEFRYLQNEASEFSTNPYGLSLDRIDNAKGYTKTNTRLVLVAVNTALNEWGVENFLVIARAALEHADRLATGS